MSDTNYITQTRGTTCAMGEQDSSIPLHLRYPIYLCWPHLTITTTQWAREPNGTWRKRGGSLCSALLSGACHMSWMWVTPSSADSAQLREVYKPMWINRIIFWLSTCDTLQCIDISAALYIALPHTTLPQSPLLISIKYLSLFLLDTSSLSLPTSPSGSAFRPFIFV